MDNISVEICRCFSAKARRYMLTYQHKATKAKSVHNSTDGDKTEKMEWTLYLNEKTHNRYSSHRDMNGIDGEFIQIVIHESIGVKHEFGEV